MGQTQASDEGDRASGNRMARRALTPPATDWSTGLRRAQARAVEGRERLAQRREEARRMRLITSWLRSLER